MQMKRMSLAPFMFLMSACSALTVGDPDVVVRTDARRYVARQTGTIHDSPTYEVRVIVRTENRSPQPVYLATCSPDSRIPSYGVPLANWPGESGWDAAWGCVGHNNHIRVDPATARIDTLPLFAPTIFDGVTHEPHGVLAGRFRIRYSVASCHTHEPSCHMRGVGDSNDFMITLP